MDVTRQEDSTIESRSEDSTRAVDDAADSISDGSRESFADNKLKNAYSHSSMDKLEETTPFATKSSPLQRRKVLNESPRSSSSSFSLGTSSSSVSASSQGISPRTSIMGFWRRPYSTRALPETNGELPESIDENHETSEASTNPWSVKLVLRNFFKLATHEDPMNVHKLLGVASLTHYIYRFVRLALTGTMGFEKDPQWRVLLFIFVHLALSWSSYVFHLPPRRNRAKPMIWPELRAHNVVFATRSLADMLLHTLGFGGISVLRTAVAFIAIYAADRVTDHFKRLALLSKDDSTMRGMPWPPGTTPGVLTLMNLYYGTSQLFATMGVINVSRHWHYDVELAFTVLFAVQLSALLMTLVRKSILEPFGWHFYYALSLGLSWVLNLVRLAETTSIVNVFVRGAIMVPLVSALRFKLNVNKYVLWLGFALVDAAVLQKAYVDYPFTPLVDLPAWATTNWLRMGKDYVVAQVVSV